LAVLVSVSKIKDAVPGYSEDVIWRHHKKLCFELGFDSMMAVDLKVEVDRLREQAANVL